MTTTTPFAPFAPFSPVTVLTHRPNSGACMTDHNQTDTGEQPATKLLTNGFSSHFPHVTLLTASTPKQPTQYNNSNIAACTGERGAR